MADSKLDVSLDDLIKRQAAKSGPAKGGKGGGQAGTKLTGRGVKLGVSKGRGGVVSKATARPPQRGPLPSSERGSSGARRGGGVITIRNPVAQRTRHAPPPPGGYGGPRRAGQLPMDKPPAGKWRHDLYDPHQPAGPSSVAAAQGSNVIRNKLFISNLAHNVHDADITELFEAMGKIKDAGVHYDRSGRSKGTAHVVFERAADALEAYNKYNNVALDGKKLNIELVETEVAPGHLKQLSSGISVSLFSSGGGGGGGGGSSRAGGGFGSNRPRSFVRGRGVPSGGDAMQE